MITIVYSINKDTKIGTTFTLVMSKCFPCIIAYNGVYHLLWILSFV